MVEKLVSQLPKYERAVNPPELRLQARDVAMFHAIHNYDGVLARRQVKRMFWPNASTRAMEMRLSKLYHNGYLNWPNLQQRKTKPIPEPILWLGWRGALEVARHEGIEIKPPSKVNESQLRSLQVGLRQQGIRWAREPNWNQPGHDLAVADFRLAVERSLQQQGDFRLEYWIPESTFRAEPDFVKYTITGKNGRPIQRKKGVCPDGYFVITDKKRLKEGKASRARFLLELDMATHDNPSFGVEKAAPGVAYIQSQAYKARFGANSGRWLIVTTGEIRLKNLMQQTEDRTGRNAGWFFFTTLDRVEDGNVFTDRIWKQVGKDYPVALLDQ